MIHYILQVVVFQCAFLILFELILRRQSFFSLNRFYLIGSSMASFVIPLLKLDLISQASAPYGTIMLPEIVLGTPITNGSQINQNVMDAAGIMVQEPQTPIWQLPLLLGCGLFALWFAIKCIRLALLHYNNPKRWSNNVLVVELPNSFQAFSFFNIIFLGSNLGDNDRNIIMEHELVHVRHKHSIDIIWFQLMRIFMWFNPCVYWYQHRITELHEFIADREVLKTESSGEYYRNLLQQIFQVKSVALTNSFFSNSLIKKRIIMLQQSQSRKSALWRYTLIVPLTLAMLFYVSCDKEVVQDDPYAELNLDQYSYQLVMDTDKNLVEQGLQPARDRHAAFLKDHPDFVSWALIDSKTNTISYSIHHKDEEPNFKFHEMEVRLPNGTEYLTLMNFPLFGDDSKVEIEKESKRVYDGELEVPFAVIDQVPTYETCQDLVGEERKRCTSMEVAKFVNKNFNTSIANQYNLKGRQRIYVYFKIDTNGDIIDIGARAPHEALEAEAIRVIGELPKFIPGVHNGEAVVVPYSLPILFQVNE